MARKVVDVTVQDEGRDKGKVFRITEMPARKAADWAVRFLTALINAGYEIPEEVMRGGLGAVAIQGFGSISRLSSADAIALKDELLSCVQIVPSPGSNPMARALVESDIEEMPVVFWLTKEVFDLHTGFLRAAVQSNKTSE